MPSWHSRGYLHELCCPISDLDDHRNLQSAAWGELIVLFACTLTIQQDTFGGWVTWNIPPGIACVYICMLPQLETMHALCTNT